MLLANLHCNNLVLSAPTEVIASSTLKICEFAGQTAAVGCCLVRVHLAAAENLQTDGACQADGENDAQARREARHEAC